MDQQIDINSLKARVKAIVKRFDLGTKEKRIDALEKDSSEPALWKDQNKAKKTLSELSELKISVDSVKALQGKLKELEGLVELANEDSSLQPEIQNELKSFETALAKKELETFLSGKYDRGNAILSIFAGQGGTEACDWVEMLLRMYTKFIESSGWQSEILDIRKGEEAGISSVTLEVKGEFVYGYLKFETGTHRLVRISPFNAQALRQTSFAGVEVLPLFEHSEIEIDIKPDDLVMTTSRSGGKGGQNVNKVSTKVTLLHKLSGIQVVCSSERSQLQNRTSAMKILRAKLYKAEEEKRENQLLKIKGDHKMPTWGNQIRNYVLHPYKQVKDLRTNVESSNPEEVLNGNLSLFVESAIRSL